MLTGALGAAVSAGLLWSALSAAPVETLSRPAYGSGNRTQTLRARVGEESYPVEVTVRPAALSEEEIMEELESAKNRLEALFLNGNEGLERIVSDVSMPAQIPDTQVAVQWYADSWELIRPDGTVENGGLAEKQSVQVQATLTLEEKSLTWQRTAVVCPAGEAQTRKLLEYALADAQEQEGELVRLPDRIRGKEILWYPEKDTRWLWAAALTAAALAGLFIGRKKDEEKVRRQWERNMQLAYPDIVSRLSLYMGAGLGTRKAWERIVESSEQTGDKNQKSEAAYREMRTTLREMQSGVPEAAAYEQFGTRCRLPSYLKLGTLLSQNLRQGTRNLAGLLQAEAREAFEDRKALARKLGEECESKLLLPMLLMLLTILIMVMYPAAVSFGA